MTKKHATLVGDVNFTYQSQIASRTISRVNSQVKRMGSGFESSYAQLI